MGTLDQKGKNKMISPIEEFEVKNYYLILRQMPEDQKIKNGFTDDYLDACEKAELLMISDYRRKKKSI